MFYHTRRSQEHFSDPCPLHIPKTYTSEHSKARAAKRTNFCTFVSSHIAAICKQVFGPKMHHSHRKLFTNYPLARNQYINNSPGVFSCIRAGANTGATEMKSLQNLANMRKMIPQKYFPVFALARIQAPHVFAQKIIPQEFFLHVLVLCRGVCANDSSMDCQQYTRASLLCPEEALLSRCFLHHGPVKNRNRLFTEEHMREQLEPVRATHHTALKKRILKTNYSDTNSQVPPQKDLKGMLILCFCWWPTCRRATQTFLLDFFGTFQFAASIRFPETIGTDFSLMVASIYFADFLSRNFSQRFFLHWFYARIFGTLRLRAPIFLDDSLGATKPLPMHANLTPGVPANFAMVWGLVGGWVDERDQWRK